MLHSKQAMILEKTWVTTYSLVVLFSQFWTNPLFLTVASWSTYSFLRRQIRWSGTPILLMILLWFRVKGFSIVSKAEVDVFLELLCFLHDQCWQFDLWLLSAFSKSNLYIQKFSVRILLKPSLKDFEHNLASMWNEHKWMVVWAFFGIALLWEWNENWPFPVLWLLLSFSNLLTYWTSHFNSITF